MEVQLAVKSARTKGDATTNKAIVPNYLLPSTGSCHHACKYGGTHNFEDAHQPKTRRQPPVSDHRKRTTTTTTTPVRARLVPRKLFSRGDKVTEHAAAAVNEERKKNKNQAETESESVEWKDIAAYNDDAAVPSHGPSLPDQLGNQPSSVGQLMDGAKGRKGPPEDKKKLALVKPPPAVGSKTTIAGKQEAPSRSPEPPTTPHKKTMDGAADGTAKGARPPGSGRGGKKKRPALLVANEKKKAAAVVDQEQLVNNGYRSLSPSLLQQRASLLRQLQAEMVRDEAAADGAMKNGTKIAHALDDQEESAAAAAETRGPVPAHRRAKSMSISTGSSRSVRFPFARQASKSSAAFKLRSKSSSRAGPMTLPSEGEKPARLRSRRGSVGSGVDVAGSTGTGRGIQLRIRSLRRRGLGGSAGGGSSSSTGFVVPAVALRHQKTLEKKRSQRLYNNVIEETASKLVKARKSRVKALVGAFESVISRIAK